MRIPQAGDAVIHREEMALTCDHAASTEGNDIRIGGWLTTEKLNSYRQIVHASTFDHEDGLAKWGGRILMEHGRRFLVGGGDGTPVGRISSHSFVQERGMYGSGFIYNENPALLKRAIRDGTLASFSIGFVLSEDGAEYDEKKDILNITKGELHEVSLCDVGACDEATFKVLNSVRAFTYTLENKKVDYTGWCYVTYGGRRYLCNPEGELHNV